MSGAATGRPAGLLGRGWVRWTVPAVIVAVALVVALWPRGSGGQGGAAPAVAPPDLTAARAAAAAAPCPHPAAAAPAASPLKNVLVSCTADGKPVSLASVTAGGPVLVNVWASWCTPCRDELPVLAGYAATPGALPVFEVEYHLDDQAGALRELAELGVRLPGGYDSTGAAQRALKVPPALPASYLLGADGTPVKLTVPGGSFTSAGQISAVLAGAGR